MNTRVYIRQPILGDQDEFLSAVDKSRALHHPWISPPDTPMKFRVYIEHMDLPDNSAFLVCRRGTDAFVGVVNITNIMLGPFRSGYLSYYAFAKHARQGLMRQGLCAVIRYAFKELKLHRLEANIQPANVPSLALAASCGFAKEGYSPRYLKIGGRWRDHERWAILAS
jgi:ribosomal-protein-alanine N-acetyltransferase